MALQISPEMMVRINNLVTEGDYPDVDTLLDQALHLIEEHRAEEHLRSLLEVGVEDVRSSRTHRFTEERRMDLWLEVLRQEGIT